MGWPGIALTAGTGPHPRKGKYQERGREWNSRWMWKLAPSPVKHWLMRPRFEVAFFVFYVSYASTNIALIVILKSYKILRLKGCEKNAKIFLEQKIWNKNCFFEFTFLSPHWACWRESILRQIVISKIRVHLTFRRVRRKNPLQKFRTFFHPGVCLKRTLLHVFI